MINYNRSKSFDKIFYHESDVNQNLNSNITNLENIILVSNQISNTNINASAPNEPNKIDNLLKLDMLISNGRTAINGSKTIKKDIGNNFYLKGQEIID